MRTHSVAHAKAHLSALLEQIEQGQEVLITRRGQPVARLVPADKNKAPLNFQRLQKLRASQTMASTSAATLVRAMRDAERY